MPGMRTRNRAVSWETVAVWCGIAGLLGLRLVGLSVFPAPHSDEGFWAVTAKNAVTFGDPFLGVQWELFLSPLNFAVLYLVWHVLPWGLLTARLVSVGWSALTLGVLYLWGRRTGLRWPWLPLLWLGFSSFAVINQRMMLLEPHQIFWLSLAALGLVCGGPVGCSWAGLAFGAAMVVKINTLLLLPAFVLALLRPVAPSPWPRFAWLREAVCFLAGAGLVAVGVYGTLAICFPVETNGVFQYQAGSGPRLPEGVVWHFGRWGYAPPALHRSLRALALNMPDLVLALWGGIRVWPRRDRTGRLLVLWATTVLLFTLTQIYQPPRYFLVALPAVVWLSAMGMEDLHERLAARSTARRATLLVSGLVAAFALFHLVRLGYSAALTIPRNDYPQRTAWLRQVLPADAHVAAAPYLALELPGPVYDFFRICWPYGCSGPVRSLRQATETFDLTYFVVDGMEWQTYLWPEDEEFLRTDCEVVGRFRDLTVYRREGKRKEGEGREKRGQKG